MGEQPIKKRPSLDLKDPSYGKRVKSILSQTINRLRGKGYDPSLLNDFCSSMNRLGIIHQGLFFFMAFDFSSRDFFILDLKSSNFLEISGYLIERISQAR